MKRKWMALVLLAALLAGCAAGQGTEAAGSEIRPIAPESTQSSPLEPEAEAVEGEAGRPDDIETGWLRAVPYAGSAIIEVPGGLLMSTNDFDEEATATHGDIRRMWNFWFLDVENRRQTHLGAIQHEGLDLRLNRRYSPAQMFYAGGQVYIMDDYTLYRMDVEKGELTPVYSRKPSPEGSGLFEYWDTKAAYTDGSYFYMVIITEGTDEEDDYGYNKPKHLVRINLATGERENLYKLQYYEEAPSGCMGDEILLKCQVYERDWYEFHNEDHSWYDEAGWQANFAKGVQQVRAVDIHTGAMRVLYDGGEGSAEYGGSYIDGYQDAGNAYMTKSVTPLGQYGEGPYELFLFEFVTGSWRSLFAADNWNCNVWFYDEAMGRMLVSEPDFDNMIDYPNFQTEGEKYWAVYTNGVTPPEEWRMLPEYIPDYKAAASPVVPLARWGDYYLVKTGQASELVRLWHEDGTFTREPYDIYKALYDPEPPLAEEPEYMEEYFLTAQLSLILCEDYWNQQANYLPITVTEG